MKTRQIAPVVIKIYDFVIWILPKLEKFPRSQKFLLGDRIQNILLDCFELLIEANYSREKADVLKKANLKLEKLRFLIRVSMDMHYLNIKGYEFASKKIDEIGRMVGGWIRSMGNQKMS